MGIREAQENSKTTAATITGAAFACSTIGTAVLTSLMAPNRNPSCKKEKAVADRKELSMFDQLVIEADKRKNGCTGIHLNSKSCSQCFEGWSLLSKNGIAEFQDTGESEVNFPVMWLRVWKRYIPSLSVHWSFPGLVHWISWHLQHHTHHNHAMYTHAKCHSLSLRPMRDFWGLWVGWKLQVGGKHVRVIIMS